MKVIPRLLILTILVQPFLLRSENTIRLQVKPENWFVLDEYRQTIQIIFHAALEGRLAVYDDEELKDKLDPETVHRNSVHNEIFFAFPFPDEPEYSTDTMLELYKDKINWIRGFSVCEQFVFNRFNGSYTVSYRSLGLLLNYTYGYLPAYWFSFSDLRNLLGNKLYNALLQAIKTNTFYLFNCNDIDFQTYRKVELENYFSRDYLKEINENIEHFAGNLGKINIYRNKEMTIPSSYYQYMSKISAVFTDYEYYQAWTNEYKGDSLVVLLDTFIREHKQYRLFSLDSITGYRLNEIISYRKDQLGYSCRFRAFAMTFINYKGHYQFEDELFWISFEDFNKIIDESEILSLQYFFMRKTMEDHRAWFGWVQLIFVPLII